jgi:hypothetical protein
VEPSMPRDREAEKRYARAMWFAVDQKKTSNSKPPMRSRTGGPDVAGGCTVTTWPPVSPDGAKTGTPVSPIRSRRNGIGPVGRPPA